MSEAVALCRMSSERFAFPSSSHPQVPLAVREPGCPRQRSGPREQWPSSAWGGETCPPGGALNLPPRAEGESEGWEDSGCPAGGRARAPHPGGPSSCLGLCWSSRRSKARSSVSRRMTGTSSVAVQKSRVPECSSRSCLKPWLERCFACLTRASCLSSGLPWVQGRSLLGSSLSVGRLCPLLATLARSCLVHPAREPLACDFTAAFLLRHGRRSTR